MSISTAADGDVRAQGSVCVCPLAPVCDGYKPQECANLNGYGHGSSTEKYTRHLVLSLPLCLLKDLLPQPCAEGKSRGSEALLVVEEDQSRGYTSLYQNM